MKSLHRHKTLTKKMYSNYALQKYREERAVEGEKPHVHTPCLPGQKRVTRYYITLSFRFLVVQTARVLPALRN